jgi:Protein of unknown function (DUF1403)
MGFSCKKRRYAIALDMAASPHPPLPQALPPVPAWLRRDPGPDDQAALYRAGAALALLDARMRADAPFAGTWRRRLALGAAVASARQLRRGEDEAHLRDAFYLRAGPTDEPGPAGRLVIAWRGLERPAPLSENALHPVAATLGLPWDDALRDALAAGHVLATSDRPAPVAAAEAARALMRHRPDALILALWLADAVLAAGLKWPLPLPLLATGLVHVRDGGRRPHPADATWAAACCRATTAAAVQACDLFAELDRRSQTLLAVAPRLRAKGADAMVQALLSEDAVAATKQRSALSDRGQRRLFDRLVALGAVRELTGRATFRLYGL